MSKPVDYSKWDKIELSDDEEDVHPNIDKDSWFRMKHRSRVEREDHEEKDRKRINEEVRVTAHYLYLVSCLASILPVHSISPAQSLLCFASRLLPVDGKGQPTHQNVGT
jgi:hypothetical protein